MVLSAKVEGEGMGSAPIGCVSCGGPMESQKLKRKVLKGYLDYIQRGGSQCPSCYTGITTDRESQMNVSDWLDETGIVFRNLKRNI